MVFLILPLKRQIMMERGITFILFDPLMFLKVWVKQQATLILETSMCTPFLFLGHLEPVLSNNYIL